MPPGRMTSGGFLIRTPRRFQAPIVSDPARAEAPASSEQLAPALESRIAALERGASSSDFDRAAWGWMILFGMAIPLALILLGWWA